MKTLTEEDYINAAALLNCDVAAIKAVASVESNGSGFLKNGAPKILFEGHWFYKLTNGKYGYTSYSYPKWTRIFYNMDQHKRLQDAAEKDRTAALMSASWGKFQIMGLNYKRAGFNSVQEFVNAMYRSEAEHLLAFCHFIISKRLDDELRNHQWDRFAYNYNGKYYRRNKYAKKMAKAYAKYSN